MEKKIIRLTESDLRNIVKKSIGRILKEGWNGDRFEYDHFSDEGNGGIEEYGHNIAHLLFGLGSDPDSLHAVGEEVAQCLISPSQNGMKATDNKKEEILKPFIEGLIAVYKSGDNLLNPSPQDIYDQYGIVRN